MYVITLQRRCNLSEYSPLGRFRSFDPILPNSARVLEGHFLSDTSPRWKNINEISVINDRVYFKMFKVYFKTRCISMIDFTIGFYKTTRACVRCTYRSLDYAKHRTPLRWKRQNDLFHRTECVSAVDWFFPPI